MLTLHSKCEQERAMPSFFPHLNVYAAPSPHHKVQRRVYTSPQQFDHSVSCPTNASTKLHDMQLPRESGTEIGEIFWMLFNPALGIDLLTAQRTQHFTTTGTPLTFLPNQYISRSHMISWGCYRPRTPARGEGSSVTNNLPHQAMGHSASSPPGKYTP